MKREHSFISNFKLIAEVLVFILLFSAVYKVTETKYAAAAEQNVVNAWTKSRFDGFYAQEENTVDMVFIGSSHSYCTFDPENFDKELGTLSWQLGTPLQHYDTSLYTLKEVYKTQSPKVVVLEFYWDMLDDEFDMKQANSFFEVVNDKSVTEDYVKNVFPINEKVKYKLLHIRYQQDYFAYESAEIEKKTEERFRVTKKAAPETNGTEYYLDKGYTYCDTVIPESEFYETNQYKNFDGADWEADDTQKEYLRQFVKLARENGSEVVFVTAPIANISMELIDNYDDVHNELAAISEELGVKYLDFNIVNMRENLFKLENFRDDAHLNDSGVKIADKYYIEWLRNNTETFGNNN